MAGAARAEGGAAHHKSRTRAPRPGGPPREPLRGPGQPDRESVRRHQARAPHGAAPYDAWPPPPPKTASMTQGLIRIRGARQHNLKNLDLDIRTGEMTVVTGPSGSGKSSPVFDTLYAEGQRRYVETFSAYARQFLERMDRPAVDKVEGVPPAIAIDQTNPVRSSRSTVGTMTELNDHLKL